MIVTSEEVAMVAQINIPRHEVPSTSRSGGNGARMLPNYDAEPSNLDSDLSPLQAQQGSRDCGTASRVMTSKAVAMVA